MLEEGTGRGGGGLLVLKLFHRTGHSGNLPSLFNGSSVPRVTDHILGKRCPASCSLWPKEQTPKSPTWAASWWVHWHTFGRRAEHPGSSHKDLQRMVKMKKAEALSSVE